MPHCINSTGTLITYLRTSSWSQVLTTWYKCGHIWQIFNCQTGRSYSNNSLSSALFNFSLRINLKSTIPHSLTWFF